MPVESGGAAGKKEVDRVVIRPWPKAVLLYPTLGLSIVFGVLTTLLGEGETSGNHSMATAWLLVFAVNISVMTFEFSRLKTMAGIFGLLAAIFLALFLGERYDFQIFSWVTNALRSLGPAANAQFYLCMSVLLGLIFAGMLMRTRVDWWEVHHNELLHHHGLMGNVERLPALNMRITKEIDDMAEYLMLRSGTIVFMPPGEGRAIRLENVPGVNRIEKDLQQLLSKMSVDIDPQK